MTWFLVGLGIGAMGCATHIDAAPGGQADASAVREVNSECPGGLSCLPSPGGLGRPETCVDPAGYRFVSELCSATCEPLELDGERWEQECVEGVEVGGEYGTDVVTGCSPVCRLTGG